MATATIPGSLSWTGLGAHLAKTVRPTPKSRAPRPTVPRHPREKPMTNANAVTTVTTGTVTSTDGTTVGYRRVRQGPAIVMLHGSMESSTSHLQLALELAD